jgi:hypothetical protein
MRKYADIPVSFVVMGYSAPLRLAYRFASEKLPNPANQLNPFYIAKTDISKIVAFKGAEP